MLHKSQTLIICTILAGCSSATRNIAQSANQIGGLASTSKMRFETIADTAIAGATNDKNIRDINASAISGIEEQSKILSLVDDVHSDLTRVSDNTPWWAAMLSKIATAAAIIGVAFVLWQTGIGYLVKRIVYSFGWFIPASVRREVALDSKNIETDNPATLRESIAAKRASNPAYDAAWKHNRRK
jgi:hypothetical protein